MTLHSCALALGSNIGDKEANLNDAIAAIGDITETRVTRVSQYYQTAPWGDLDQDWFLNACAKVETELPPLPLLSALKDIESSLGRTKTRRWGPRVIDIDILTYDTVAMAEDTLTIPHPRMTERAFVLVPLAEIWPDLRVNGQSIETLLAQLSREDGDVFPYKP